MFFHVLSLQDHSVPLTLLVPSGSSPPASGWLGFPLLLTDITQRKQGDRLPRWFLHLSLNHHCHHGTSLLSLIAHKWLLLEPRTEQPMHQPVGCWGSSVGMSCWKQAARLLLSLAKCPLAWDPRSALGLPLIWPVCCQVSIRQPVIQLVLAQVLRKINQRMVSNRSESLTTIFGEATRNHCP